VKFTFENKIFFMKKSNYFKWLLAIAAMLQFNIAFAQSTNCETFVTPSVTIVSDQNSVCEGMPITFTATPVNGGETPVYQWYVNEILQTADKFSTFSTVGLTDENVVSVKLTSSEHCVVFQNAVSNRVTVNVYSGISAGYIGTDTTICNNVIPNPIKEVSPPNYNSGLVYSWQMSEEGQTWTRIAAATVKTFTFNAPLLNTTYFRREVISNEKPIPCNIATSNSVKIKVIDGPECQPTHTNDQTIEATKTILGIYNIQGMEVDKNYKGLVLYKYSDGSISKMLQE
jgi:hypothetical protein